MLRTSPTSVMQSSINWANNKFDRVDCGKDKAKILSVSSMFKNKPQWLI